MRRASDCFYQVIEGLLNALTGLVDCRDTCTMYSDTSYQRLHHVLPPVTPHENRVLWKQAELDTSPLDPSSSQMAKPSSLLFLLLRFTKAGSENIVVSRRLCISYLWLHNK